MGVPIWRFNSNLSKLIRNCPDLAGLAIQELAVDGEQYVLGACGFCLQSELALRFSKTGQHLYTPQTRVPSS
jgi:hypothetical protein